MNRTRIGAVAVLGFVFMSGTLGIQKLRGGDHDRVSAVAPTSPATDVPPKNHLTEFVFWKGNGMCGISCSVEHPMIAVRDGLVFRDVDGGDQTTSMQPVLGSTSQTITAEGRRRLLAVLLSQPTGEDGIGGTTDVSSNYMYAVVDGKPLWVPPMAGQGELFDRFRQDKTAFSAIVGESNLGPETQFVPKQYELWTESTGTRADYDISPLEDYFTILEWPLPNAPLGANQPECRPVDTADAAAIQAVVNEAVLSAEIVTEAEGRGKADSDPSFWFGSDESVDGIDEFFEVRLRPLLPGEPVCERRF
jgi:hypothetical protein